jgi:hypothetical protein
MRTCQIDTSTGYQLAGRVSTTMSVYKAEQILMVGRQARIKYLPGGKYVYY